MLAPEGLGNIDLTPADGQQILSIITRRRDRRLLVQSDRIPIAEAREILAEEDRAGDAEGWKNVLLLGSPVLLLGLLIMFVIERFKKHRYLLPGEGRNAAKRERKNREKLNQLTTEPMRMDEHENKNPKDAELPADAGDPADAGQPAGQGGK